MSRTTALVPYPFEGHRIRVSTDEDGYAWFVAADVAGTLGQLTIGRALASLREEEQCLYSQEGPGSQGCTLALISEGGLLRLLLLDSSQTAWRMRRWLTHELLPAIQRCHQYSRPLGGSPIEAIRRQTAAEVLRKAEEIIDLTGVSHAEALLSVLESFQSSSATPALEEASCLRRHAIPAQLEQLGRTPMHKAQHFLSARHGIAWLTSEQVADRLERTLRGTNQRLAASGLQIRNDEDDWQLTETGRDWGVALPICSRGERKQQILWDPAVVALLVGEG